MKRISSIILAGTMLISLTSCRPDVSVETDYEVRLKSQPVVYQSGNDLYIVKEDNKPRKIVSGKFDGIDDNAFTDMFNIGGSVIVKGLFKISYDHQQLAFAQPDKAKNDKITLYLADTNKEHVQEICDDLSCFAAGTTVSSEDAFKFASNGDLYYLKNNRTNMTTDLYLYRKGKSKFVASNVINFYLSDDNKKIMYTGGNEYSEDNKPSVTVEPETFMAKWHCKYESSAFTLSLYDIHTKKVEVLSTHTNVKQYNYDMQSLSFVDYTERDGSRQSVKRHYGAKPTSHAVQRKRMD